MHWVAIVSFAIAVAAGISLVSLRFSRNCLPVWLAGVHGVFAGLGLILLSIHVAANGGSPLLVVSLAIFVLAALGGVTMFFGYYLRSQPLPIPLMLSHGGLGATALTLTLVGAA